MGLLDGMDLDDDLKASIEEKIRAETEGLISKRDELLGKVTKNNKKLREMELNNTNLFDKLGITDYSEIDDLVIKGEKSKDDDDLTARELKKLENKLNEVLSEKEHLKAQFSKNTINNSLKADLLKAGVKSEMVDALSLSLINKTKFELVKDESGNFQAINEVGITPAEFVESWAKSEESKIWRNAPQTVGGGSAGSASKGKVGFVGMSFDDIANIKDSHDRKKAMQENGYIKK